MQVVRDAASLVVIMGRGVTLGAPAFLQHSRDGRFRSAACSGSADTTWMPRSRRWDSMDVASTLYEGDADRLPGVTAVR